MNYPEYYRVKNERTADVTELRRLSDAVKSSGGYQSARLLDRTTKRYDDATIIMDDIDKLYIEIFDKYDKNDDYESKIESLKDEIMDVINNYNWHVDIEKYPPLYDPNRTWEQWWEGRGKLSRKHVRKSVRKCVRKIRPGRGKSRRRSRSGGK